MGAGWSRLRAAVLRSEPDCWCGRPAVTVDHVQARAFGGTDDRSNLRSLCAQHAAEKNAADALEGRLRRRR
ncbi:MAG: HNH endonuclease [Actinobacteria bacterium]|nr:HNH endonuclease [Actinomycetota bacterium]